jgi:hypothetical protein
MGVQLQWNGLNEFRNALRKLPEHLAEEAAGIVEAAADGAARTIQANYPAGPTGNLKRGVRVSRDRSPAATKAVVSSRAPHAFIFEKGTTQRRTDRGFNRGRMPSAPESRAFIPVAIKARASMIGRLIELLRREGFTVNR